MVLHQDITFAVHASICRACEDAQLWHVLVKPYIYRSARHFASGSAVSHYVHQNVINNVGCTRTRVSAGSKL